MGHYLEMGHFFWFISWIFLFRIFSGCFDTSGSMIPRLVPEILPLVVVGIGDSRSWIACSFKSNQATSFQERERRGEISSFMTFTKQNTWPWKNLDQIYAGTVSILIRINETLGAPSGAQGLISRAALKHTTQRKSARATTETLPLPRRPQRGCATQGWGSSPASSPAFSSSQSTFST